MSRDILLLWGAATVAYGFVFALTEAGLDFPPVALPALLALPAALLLVRYLNGDDRGGALVVMAGWAVALVVVGTLAMAAAPEAAAGTVWNGARYQEEMMTWLRTGEGTEGDPRAFLRVHLLRLVLFVPLALLSGGFLGLLMGAAMVNYMDFFVASYAAAAGGGAALLAWFPWALCRVTAFVILGVLAAEPLVRRFRAGSWRHFAPGTRRLTWIAAGWLLADVMLVRPLFAPLLRDFLAAFESLPPRLWMAPGLLLRVAAAVVVLVAAVRALGRAPEAPPLPAPARRTRLLAAAIVLLIVDAGLKALLAPAWGRHLAGFLP